MANKQPGFIVYGEFEEQISMLTDEEAGQLLKALFCYFNTGEVVELTPMANMVFSFMRRRIDMQAEKYDTICKKRAEAGKKGNQVRWGTDSKCDNNITNASKCEQMVANVANINKNININQTKTETKTKTKRFIKPTVEQIAAYCKERENDVDANKFFDFYEGKGWVIGKSPMKDWKAAVRTWETRNNTQASKYTELADDELPF